MKSLTERLYELSRKLQAQGIPLRDAAEINAAAAEIDYLKGEVDRLQQSHAYFKQENRRLRKARLALPRMDMSR